MIEMKVLVDRTIIFVEEANQLEEEDVAGKITP